LRAKITKKIKSGINLSKIKSYNQARHKTLIFVHAEKREIWSE
jgi:hypothetical protein